MTHKPFASQVERVQKKLETLQRRVRTDPEAISPLTTEALAELSTALEELTVAGEELHVAEEELRRRNRALVAARAEVEAERRRYRALFELAPDGYLVTDLQGVIREANRAATRLFNVPIANLEGKPLTVFVPPATRPEFRTQLNRLAEGTVRHVGNWELPLQPREGEPFYASITLAVQCDGRGAPDGLRWLIRDVSARVRAQEALWESMEKYRVLFESFPLGITVADDEGRILESNAASERLLGISPAEQARRHVGGEEWQIIRPDGSPMPTAEYASVRALEEGHPVRGVEMGIVKPAGGVTWIEVTAAPLGDERVVVAYVDVSRRKQAEERLEQYARELERSNEDLQQFAYIVSHDLREPLRTVTSFLRLLEERYGDQLTGAGQEFIAYAVDGVTRMQRMIGALLDLSRVETHGQPLTPTDCEAMMEQTLATLHHMVEETDARVTCGPLPTVMADEGQLLQVFQNLVANALKFRREGVPPEVHVTGRREDSRWHFTVRDNGIGVDPAQAERAFQIFQRLHTRAEYEGTGIGLALSRRIVERHGGRIWMEPAAEGPGTAVHFTLPAYRPAPA
jgi:PAS domain S-box-containing protein